MSAACSGELFFDKIHAQPVVRHLHVARSTFSFTIAGDITSNLAVQFPGVEPGTLNTLRWQSWNTTLHYNRLRRDGQSAFKR